MGTGSEDLIEIVLRNHIGSRWERLGFVEPTKYIGQPMQKHDFNRWVDSLGWVGPLSIKAFGEDGHAGTVEEWLNDQTFSGKWTSCALEENRVWFMRYWFSCPADAVLMRLRFS